MRSLGAGAPEPLAQSGGLAVVSGTCRFAADTRKPDDAPLGKFVGVGRLDGE